MNKSAINLVVLFPRLVLLLACCLLFLAGCSPTQPAEPTVPSGESASEEPIVQDAKKSESALDPLTQRVAETMDELTLEQKVAQMFIVRPTDLDDPDATIEVNGKIHQKPMVEPETELLTAAVILVLN